MHCVNGSPVKSLGQTHIGVWLTTRHSALFPHEPTQGFAHLLFIHAKWEGHSLLLMHSGLQFGGEPKNPPRQEHEGVSPITRHSAFVPQGDGAQGFACITGSDADEKREVKSLSQVKIFAASKKLQSDAAYPYVVQCIGRMDLLSVLLGSYK